MPNLYLIGMMGSGKSVTGIKLAELLGCPFTDLDETIRETAGKSIPAIFKEKGETGFRDEESRAIEEVSGKSPQVVATGGGIVLRPENVAAMKATGKLIYLETSEEVLWERVRGKKGRPLLDAENPRERLSDLLKQRKPLYEKLCDLSVRTDGRSAEDVAQEILSKVESPS